METYTLRIRKAGDSQFTTLEVEMFTAERTSCGVGGEEWSPSDTKDKLVRVECNGPHSILYDQHGIVAVSWANMGPIKT